MQPSVRRAATGPQVYRPGSTLQRMQAEDVAEDVYVEDEDFEVLLDMGAEDLAKLGLSPTEKSKLGKIKEAKAKAAKQLEKDTAALKTLRDTSRTKDWEYEGVRYHINLWLGTYHVTREESPKTHYFFEGTGAEITDAQPTPSERGRNAETKTVFSHLPADVQSFVRTYWSRLIK